MLIIISEIKMIIWPKNFSGPVVNPSLITGRTWVFSCSDNFIMLKTKFINKFLLFNLQT